MNVFGGPGRKLATRRTGGCWPLAPGWRGRDLTTRRKGDPAKVKLAAAVRAQMTMPLAWMAKRLAMGSRGYLTWLLYRQANPS